MGTRMRGRRTWLTQAVAGLDEVMFGMWLPAGTTVRRVDGYAINEVSTISTAGEVSVGSIEGWVLPVSDPDTPGTMNALWDRLVPKNISGSVLDLDTAGDDTTPFYEPGGVYWASLFDIGDQSFRVYKKEWMASMGHNSITTRQDNQTPFGIEFVMGLTHGLHIRRPVRVKRPSLLVFAIASPLTTLTNAADAIAAIAEEDWGQLQFIDHVMERAMLSLLGVTEAGAESPWEEATALLKRHLNPQIFETIAGALKPVSWRTYGQVIIEIEVEGRMKHNVLDVKRF